jgi:nitrate reductase gamma subunit
VVVVVVLVIGLIAFAVRRLTASSVPAESVG